MARISSSLIIFLLVIFSTSEGAKILGVFHVPGPSHYLAGSTLMKILAEKGHDVTMISAFSSKDAPKNLREIVLTGAYENIASKRANHFEMTTNSLIIPLNFNYISHAMMENAFNDTIFKKFMNSGEKFDVVIMEQFQAEAMKYVAYHFKAPLIIYNAMDANEWINPYQGNPDSPAYTPNLYLPKLTCEMSFIERVFNSLQYVYGNLLRIFVTLPAQNRLLHKYYPDAPHLNDFIYNVSLVLLNADLSVHEALPKVPSMVSIGGFHIKKSKPLPEDLQYVLDNAKNGVVYFSLGSNVKSKNMPQDKRDIILKTLANLKETVIWKFEEDLPGKPDNVIIRNWLPQNDIFAHKNVKLFITHGGVFSTMEAVYHGIPILALPIFAEQNANAKRAELNGYAKVIPFRDLEERTFSSCLQELLDNPKYTENVKQRSKIMTDKPIPPNEAVNYWVEYVVRHKGAPHLRVASLKLAWYQYLLLDVIAFLTILVILLMLFIKYLISTVGNTKNKRKEKTH